MSAEYKNTDPSALAKQAERDLNSTAAKQGHGGSDSTTDSGIDSAATTKFPGASATYGSAASGAGNNRDMPFEEGGDINPAAGQMYKAGDFARGGVGAPEARDQAYAKNHGGEDDVRGNVVGGESWRGTGAK